MVLFDDDASNESVHENADKLSIFQLKINAVGILRALKSFMTFKELSQLFGIDPSSLSRYISGKVLPSLSKAELIITKSFDKKLLLKILRSIRGEEFSNVIDPSIFFFFSNYIYHSLSFKRISKIACFVPRDLLLGFSLASMLKTRLIPVYEDKNLFPVKRIEYSYSVKNPSNNMEMKKTIAIAKNSISWKDRIAIIAERMQFQEDYIALVTLIKRIDRECKLPVIIFLHCENKQGLKELESRLKMMDRSATPSVITIL